MAARRTKAPAAPFASHRDRPPALRGRALRAAKFELLSKANVVGAYIGKKRSRQRLTEETALVCLVVQKKPLRLLAVHERVPARMSWVATSRETRRFATDVRAASPFRM